MLILALNCGSSSIKSALIDTAVSNRLLRITLEEIGSETGTLDIDGAHQACVCRDIREAAERVLEQVRAAHRDLDAVAHRLVHGGEEFVRPTLLDDGVLRRLEALNELAPLHNPPALDAVSVARRMFEGIPHVAVFDTAFHATLPPRAREYALPRLVAREYGLRRFGFHGTSHAHIVQAVAHELGQEPQRLRIISCHLGNGASVCAIEYGRSVDTSMGMTPLEGLVMGSRCGDLDPGIPLRLLNSGHYDAAKLDALLNKQSGLKGLTGTNDTREIEERAAGGDETCRLAIAVYTHRIRKYVGAYAAVMGGVDAIAFTGGVGEHSALVRHRVLQRFDFLGAILDEDKNRDVTRVDSIVNIAAQESRVHIFVVPADEELSIARETAALLNVSPRIQQRIPIAVSARHAHLSQASIDALFGAGYRLHEQTPLSQPGQYAAEETVSLIGPKGRIDHVRVLGPPRTEDQVEISRSDEFVLGVDAPIRISGDMNNSPGITLEGPAGRVTLMRGVICAWRHLHASPADAQALGLKDHDRVQVRIHSAERETVFADVIVRIAPDFRLEMHLDTDEANAAGISGRSDGELLVEIGG